MGQQAFEAIADTVTLITGDRKSIGAFIWAQGSDIDDRFPDTISVGCSGCNTSSSAPSITSSMAQTGQKHQSSETS